MKMYVDLVSDDPTEVILSFTKEPEQRKFCKSHSISGDIQGIRLYNFTTESKWRPGTIREIDLSGLKFMKATKYKDIVSLEVDLGGTLLL